MQTFTDETRLKILPHLKGTETLINAIAYKLCGVTANAKVLPLEDLCVADNIVRMRGGFFTGSYIEWQCEIPFIPVDATLNACGVSVFKLNKAYTAQNFRDLVERAKASYDKERWNFCRGNHFISLCKDDDDDFYLVIHASDNSFKFGENGLYPYNGAWYENQIETIVQDDRYIRYIKGAAAEKFYSLYLQAEEQNPLRNKELCARIFGEDCFTEVLYSPHYGMPSKTSIAIGCQWGRKDLVILTAPGKDIFLFNGDSSVKYPHGFGMVVDKIESIDYKSGEFYINNKKIDGLANFIEIASLKNRFSNSTVNQSFLEAFLQGKPFNVVKRLKQIAAYTRDGYCTYIAE